MVRPFQKKLVNNPVPNMPTVSIRRSLGLAIFLSAILSMVIAWFFADHSPIWVFMPESLIRYLTNPLCLIILFVFIVLLVYAAFQFIGGIVDKRCLLDNNVHSKHLEQMASFVAGRLVPEKCNDIKQLYLKDVIAKHEFQAHKSLTPLQFGIWVLPLLGFIGTVVGISEAIAGLHPLVGASGDTGLVLGQSIGRVLAGLETAFDTTLLGLLCVIPIMMITMALKLQYRQINLLIGQPVEKQAGLG